MIFSLTRIIYTLVGLNILMSPMLKPGLKQLIVGPVAKPIKICACSVNDSASPATSLKSLYSLPSGPVQKASTPTCPVSGCVVQVWVWYACVGDARPVPTCQMFVHDYTRYYCSGATYFNCDGYSWQLCDDHKCEKCANTICTSSTPTTLPSGCAPNSVGGYTYCTH